MAGMMGQNLQLLRIQGDQGDQVPGGAPDISTKIQVFWWVGFRLILPGSETLRQGTSELLRCGKLII